MGAGWEGGMGTMCPPPPGAWLGKNILGQIGLKSVENIKGSWGKNISKKKLHDQEGKEFFRKTKKILIKNTLFITFTASHIASQIYFLDF